MIVILISITSIIIRYPSGREKDIDGFQISDFELIGYSPHGKIAMDARAPQARVSVFCCGHAAARDTSSRARRVVEGRPLGVILGGPLG